MWQASLRIEDFASAFGETSVCTIRIEYPSKRKRTLAASGIEPSRPARGKCHLPHGGHHFGPKGRKTQPPNQQMAACRALGPCAVGALSACGLAPKPDSPSFRPGRHFLRSAAPPSASVSPGYPRPLRGLGDRSSANADYAKGGESAYADTRRRAEFPLDPLPPAAGRTRAAPRKRGQARGHIHPPQTDSALKTPPTAPYPVCYNSNGGTSSAKHDVRTTAQSAPTPSPLPASRELSDETADCPRRQGSALGSQDALPITGADPKTGVRLQVRAPLS